MSAEILARLEQKMDYMLEDQKEIKSDIKDFRKCLYGNGSPEPGLVSQVRSNKEDMDELKDNIKWWKRTTFGTAFVTLKTAAIFWWKTKF